MGGDPLEVKRAAELERRMETSMPGFEQAGGRLLRSSSQVQNVDRLLLKSCGRDVVSDCRLRPLACVGSRKARMGSRIDCLLLRLQ